MQKLDHGPVSEPCYEEAMTDGTTADPTPSRTGTSMTEIEAFRALLPAGRPLLGLDLGTATIGVALSDVSLLIASPLETLRRTKFAADSARLLSMIDEHKAGGLVLGYPINMDGSLGPRAQATRAFARNVNMLCALPLLLWDERLTTAQAERMLIEADQSRKRRAEVIDKLAATLILQSVLDRLRVHER